MIVDVTTVGPYEIIRPIGRGGEAPVCLARNGRDDLVAIKVFAHIGTDDRLRHRLRRQVELFSDMDHPGLARLIDADLDADSPFLVFRYIDGVDLATRVTEGGALARPDVHGFVLGLAEALNVLHAHGVAHLDVKPQNVILRAGESGMQPVLVDFGSARAVEAAMTALPYGSPLYSSPEQLRLERVDTPSDLFSFASTVYFGVAGIPPFGAAVGVARTRILDRDWLPEPQRIEDAGPWGPALWSVLRRCWTRSPEWRYPWRPLTPDARAPSRPTADTAHLLAELRDALASQSQATGWRRGRISAYRPGPTIWSDLGARLRQSRRHCDTPMTPRQLAAQRELLGRVRSWQLWLYEMGWRIPPAELVSRIDDITQGGGELRWHYACAVNSEELGVAAQPRGSRYPIPGDHSEHVSGAQVVIEAVPGQVLDIPLLLRNAGSVDWRDRRLVMIGPRRGVEVVLPLVHPVPIPNTQAGEVVEVRVPVRAPFWAGRYRQRYKMVDAEGQWCFPSGMPLGVETVLDVVGPSDA